MMAKKSVREMNAMERKYHSLEARTFHATAMMAALLGLVAFIVGLGLYTIALSNQYISEAFNLSRNASAILREVVDIEPLADEVMENYRALSDSERKATGTKAYRAKFAQIAQREDFREARDVMADFMSSSDVDDLYIAMYSEEDSALIYICDADTDPETLVMPCDWDPVKPSEVEAFLNWDGKGMVHAVAYSKEYGWLATSGVPIQGESGETIAFVLSDVSLGNVAHGMRSFLIQYVIALTIATFILGYLLTRRIKKTVVKPINAIAAAAEKYSEDRRAGVTDKEHFTALNIRTGDEVENLSLIMAGMERDLAAYVANLTNITAEKERVTTELTMATRIQESMLPSIYPAFPERPEFDVYATMDPAREVGGDFYDFFLVDDDHLCMVIADVSGKGIPAALFMMASKIILANNAMMGKSPAEILTDTNASICSNNRMEMFVTVWLGILEISTGKLTAANAGHEYPALKKPNGDFALYKAKHGLVVGAMEGIRYHEYEVELPPGAKLFVYTDGVVEANDADNNLFGTERLITALNHGSDADPKAILGNVRAAVDDFVQGAEQFDDLTMLALTYKGPGAKGDTSAEALVEEITVDAVADNLPRVQGFVEERLEAKDCPFKTLTQIGVAVEEIFINIANYAYGAESGKAIVGIAFDTAPAAVTIIFKDRGTPYDPLAKEDPNVALSAEERDIGGLGIFMTKKIMDELAYDYRDGQNILTLKKYL